MSAGSVKQAALGLGAVRAATGPKWIRRALIGLATLLLLVVVIGVDDLPPRLDLRVGQPSPRDIEAPRTIDFEDAARTEALRADARRAVPPVLRPAPGQAGAARAAAARVFVVIGQVRASSLRTAAERAAEIGKAAGLPLSEGAAVAAATASKNDLAAAQRVAMAAVNQVLSEGVREDQLAAARERVRGIVRPAALSPGLAVLASEVAAAALRPTLQIDATQTAQRRDSADDMVMPVRIRVQYGESILRKGDVVSQAHLQILAMAGLYPPRVAWTAFGGIAVIIALLLLATGAYLAQYEPEIWATDRLVVLWSLIVVVTVFLVQMLGAPRFNNYLMPAAAGPMLVGILLGRRLAIFTAATLAVLVGLVAERELGPIVVAFVGGVVGVFATRQIHRRSDFGVAALLIGVANATAALGIGLFDGLPSGDVAVNAAYAGGNGVLAGVVTIGTLPFLEQLFGLITWIKLLELANPAHPLLRRLQLEAPGTYHHSIMVGNLAEAGAEAVAADALLVRVGTYYHDVGKLRRPAFFVENQMGIENPHDKMAPSLSALTVAAHVRDGLELAREYGLPQAIADFIPQHHGTTRLTYFYHQALERGDAIDEAAFRYEGPKPQTRETALVMLADAVEAAARSLTRPTPDRLEEVVKRLIREKLEDGQLDECGLTFRDLDRIASAFVRILTGILHPRLEYPDLEGELARRRRERTVRAR